MDSEPSELPRRRSIRLIGHDYSHPGACFVTLCITGMKCLLGMVTDGKMTCSNMGEIVAEEWKRSETLRPNIELDEYIVMPNHFHAILWIRANPSKPSEIKPGPKSGSVGAIIAQFKSASMRRINAIRKTDRESIWQH